ncbi:MAG: ATP-binding protein [Sphaerochaeta sp.]|uniref:ATP-binding protein n=1 Tax=Sphaerochaeta sp. TaxID=1972642 RepID=UPI003D12D9EF
MDPSQYRPRVIDELVEQYLQAFGAICIEGPKWCGKTWTAHMHAKSAFLVSDPAGNFQNRQLAQLDPSIVLDGEFPRLIDEWQEVPSLWDAVRFRVDDQAVKGQFILTGSATPKRRGVMHSGTGRIARLRMMSMSLYESGDSSGSISLKDICNSVYETKLTGEVLLRTIATLILRGGWPGSIGLSTKNAVLIPRMYLKNVVDDDVDKIDDIKRDKAKMRLLLRSLARNESTTVGKKKLKDDMMGVEKTSIDEDTITDYLDVFTRLFILENQKPYGASLRSSLSVKQAEKRHFTDPSFACSLLGITQEDKLIGDLQTFGFMFEALCVRDLRIYAQAFGGELYHYQDYENNEIDAVIEMPDGSWSAFEIKLGANQIDAAAQSLLKIQAKFLKPASSLCVICGLSNAAYRRPDGVYVVPLTALRP